MEHLLFVRKRWDPTRGIYAILEAVCAARAGGEVLGFDIGVKRRQGRKEVMIKGSFVGYHWKRQMTT